MASFPNRVFVYGTLKRDFPNNYVISDDNHSLFIGEAKLVEPHRMVSIEEYGVPYLLSANTGSDQQAPKEVFGEIYEVDDSMLTTLDDFEDCPDDYFRTEIACTLLTSECDRYTPGSCVTCAVYIAANPDDTLYTLPYISVFTAKNYVPNSER